MHLWEFTRERLSVAVQELHWTARGQRRKYQKQSLGFQQPLRREQQHEEQHDGQACWEQPLRREQHDGQACGEQSQGDGVK